ncbi:uncharacterized protein KY384_002396 [Bacidia gigantensis]|uniref:uncharacterized protein n=1 Tax=Bacidia gigantensis TaxID=2732470 RepID=UPI001D039D1B|nr:uncharacterized protein KY384_002396 [Bacidia gigantensis]KAG8532519.1 hypothetical protein KY384_002396 [Bacidia gigantensis]
MLGWEKCNRPEDRGCWLKKGSENFTIDTNYEIRWPQGTTRKYTLDVAEMALAPDGVCMAHGKVFNGSYPGPWIQACWGDDIEITVRNNLWYNGTTIHWHGIRQWNTAEMDGVNAITQCPIAPGQSFTYKFKAIQYGSSWYHSHYSLQYADGLAGPMTIYGPSSAGYDHAIEPILMTDWNHRSAFEDWPILKGPPKMTNILLNGKGRYNYTNPNKPGLPIAQSERYSKVLKPGKKYLLRLINTSLDTHFVFSIDGHNVTVIGADFVPVKPYVTDSVRVGIGQRYHVVVEAVPIVKSANGNYWIRTTPAIACARFQDINPDDKTGIIRYDTNNTDDPTSASRDFSTECQDEPYKSLVPKVPWTVGKASNADADNQYFVNLRKPNIKGPWHPEGKSRWTAYEEPMWLNFSQPSIRYPNPGPGKPYPKWLDIVTHDPKGKDEWIYLVITLTDKKPSTGGKDSPFVPGGHPMHLHGHDFALLAASNDPYPGTLAQIEHKLKRDNPPRRDVVLLPTGGYIVIAFKADNPGPWLLHCHIAWHASSGLAFQILENMDKMKIPAASQLAMNETCKQWDKWVGEKKNLWNTTAEIEFQDDSGI